MNSYSQIMRGLCVLLLFACSPREKIEPTVLARSKDMIDRSLLLPPIVYVMETQPLPGEYTEKPIALSQAELDKFRAEWTRLKPHALKIVKADSLQSISRYALEQMKTFSLPTNWLEKIPLRPMASFGDHRLVRFGQYKEEGYPLPAHHPLVFRRLQIFAEYDRKAQAIVQVIVTINGWVEE